MITAATPIKQISLTIRSRIVIRISFRTDETNITYGFITFNNGAVYNGETQTTGQSSDRLSAEQANNLLTTLQENYADGGFHNADGDSIYPSVTSDVISGRLNEINLADYGLPNPFISGWETRAENRLNIMGAFQQHGSVEEDATTGRNDIHLTGGLVPQKATPPSGTLSESLGDWTAQNDGDRIRMRLFPRPGQTFPVGDIDTAGTSVRDDSRVRAMIKWLNDNRESGDPLFGETDTDNLDSIEEWAGTLFTSRTFQFQPVSTQASSNIEFSITQTSKGAGQISFWMTRVSGGSLDVDTFNAYFDAKTVQFATNQEELRPPFGGTASPVTGERLILPNVELASFNDTPTWKIGAKYHVIGSVYGQTLRWTDLDAISLGVRQIPAQIFDIYNMEEIVVSGQTGNTTVRLREPSEMLVTQGSEHTFVIRNANLINADGTYGEVVVQSPDGLTNVAFIRPNEKIEFRAFWYKDGSGEIRSTDPVVRKFDVAGAAGSNYSTVGYWEWNDTQWARPIPFPTTNQQTKPLEYHSDAFEIGANTITNGSDAPIGANIHTPQAVKLLTAGTVDFSLSTTNTVGSASGTMTGVVGALRIGNTGVSSDVENVIYSPRSNITGNSTRHMEMRFGRAEGDTLSGAVEMEANTVFLPLLRYDKSGTLSPQHLRQTFYDLKIRLIKAIKLVF